MDNPTQPASIAPSIETASATTSPDNSSSGCTVYVVAIGVVLVLTLLLAGTIASIQSMISASKWSDYSDNMVSHDYQNYERYGYGSSDEMGQRAMIDYR